jgi:hypothetical protein
MLPQMLTDHPFSMKPDGTGLNDEEPWESRASYRKTDGMEVCRVV